MNTKGNIDEIFKNAASGFVAPTPSKAWERLDAVLKAKRRRRLAFWFSISGISLSIIFLSIYYFGNNKITYKTILKNNLLSQKVINQPINTKTSSTIISIKHTYKQNLAKKKVTTNINNKSKSQPNFNSQTFNKSEYSNKNQETKPNKKSEKKEIIFSTITSSDDGNEINSIKMEINNLSKTIDSTAINQKVNIDNLSKDSIFYSSSKGLNQDSLDKTTKLKAKFIPEIVFSLNLGMGFSGKISQTPKLTEITTAKTGKEVGRYTQIFGFDAGISFTKNLSLSIGFERYNINTQGKFELQQINPHYVNVNDFGYTSAGMYSIQNIETLFNSRSYNPVSYLSKLTKISQSFSVVEFPISIGYSYYYQNFNFKLTSGYSFGKIINNHIKIGDDKVWLIDGKLKNIKSNISGINLGAELFFTAGKRINLGVKSDFVFYLNSVNLSSEFSHKPWIFWIGPQLNYWF